LANRHSILIN